MGRGSSTVTTVYVACAELDTATGPAHSSLRRLASSPGEQYLRATGGVGRWLGNFCSTALNRLGGGHQQHEAKGAAAL